MVEPVVPKNVTLQIRSLRVSPDKKTGGPIGENPVNTTPLLMSAWGEGCTIAFTRGNVMVEGSGPVVNGRIVLFGTTVFPVADFVVHVISTGVPHPGDIEIHGAGMTRSEIRVGHHRRTAQFEAHPHETSEQTTGRAEQSDQRVGRGGHHGLVTGYQRFDPKFGYDLSGFTGQIVSGGHPDLKSAFPRCWASNLGCFQD